MKKRNYLSDVEDRSGNAFSVIADFEGNEEQLMDIGGRSRFYRYCLSEIWYCSLGCLCRYL